MLSASLNYSRTASFKRGENVSRLRDQDPNKVYDDTTNDDQSTKNDGTVCQVTLDGETYTGGKPACFQPPVFGTEYEYASYGTLKPSRIYAGSIGLSWASPFGLSSSLSVSARHNHKYSFQTPALTGVYSV